MHSLTDLEVLDAVAQSGSIRKAADHLSITSSALSRKILAIESFFGVELFERTSRGLRLNEAGERVALHARTQLAELDKVRGELKAIKKITSGHVKICASQSVLESFLPVHLAHFQRKNAKVTVTVNHSTATGAVRDLQDFHADIGVCLNMPDHDAIAVQAESDGMIFAVVARDHPLARSRQVTIADLAKHRLVLPPRGSGLRLMLDQQAACENTALAPVVESNTYASIAEACRTGGLITFGLSLYEQDPDSRQRLAFLRIRDMAPASIRLVKLRGRTLSPVAAKLAKYLAKKMKA